MLNKTVLFVVALLFSLTAVAVQFAGAVPGNATPMQVVSQLGGAGSGNGQMAAPQGVAVAADGTVYVADTNNDRVQVFSVDGSFLASWGSSGAGNGEFSQPQGIALDDDGTVYVTDGGNNRVQKFSNNGTFIAAWGTGGNGNGQFNLPYGVAVNSVGDVYVADADNNRIQQFTSDGTFVALWGSNGGGDGQFSYPYGIAVDSTDNVYVTDRNGNRVQKFTADGTFILKWGGDGPGWAGAGNGDGQFAYTEGIAIDADDNVYVTDRNNERVQKFTTDGTFISKWGNGAELDVPVGIAVDPTTGDVYVADVGNDRIQRYGYPYYNADLKNAETNAPVTLETPAGTAITCSSTVKESALAAQDAGYAYPVGLVDFCFSTPEADNEVILTFVTDKAAGDVVLRKFDPRTNEYATVTEAVLTDTTYNGQPAVQAVYTITDNGTLDTDADTGEIADPVGLAEVVNDDNASGTDGEADAVPGAPNTGVVTMNPFTSIVAIVVGIAAAAGIVTLRRYANK